jgi:uncharacterized protein YjlB
MASIREGTVTHRLADDGIYPNSRLPLVVYPRALAVSNPDPALVVEAAFGANGWTGSWRNGIYPFHHYHSTAHEVLGVYRGTAEVQLGGPKGVTLTLHPGDVVVIPAGVAHKTLGQSVDFAVVGAYPDGQRWDMNYGRPEERPVADEHIARVRLPGMDPVHGADGPLLALWREASRGQR